MDPQSIIIWLIVGGIAGWLASVIVKGGGSGIVMDVVIGIIGAVIAGWLLPRLHIFIARDLVGEIINALIGAVILLLVLRLVRR